MTKELNTLSPKKWTDDYSGIAPTKDADDGVRIGDVAIDSNVASSTNIWRNQANTSGDPLWIREDVSPHHEVYVAKNGSDTTGDGSFKKPYLTIKTALASITDNDSTHRYNVNVAAGIYVEDNPITLKSYVSLVGQGQFTQIQALDNNANLLEAVVLSDIQGFSLVGPTTSGAAVYSDAVQTQCLDLTIIDANYGFEMDNAAGTLLIENVLAFSAGGSIDTLVRVEAGNVFLINAQVGPSTPMTSILYANGASSAITGTGLTATNGNFVNGILIDNGARLNFDVVKLSDPPLVTSTIDYGLKADNGSSVRASSFNVAFADVGVFTNNASQVTLLSSSAFQCNTAFEIGDTGASGLNLIGSNIRQSTNYDLLISSPDATYTGTGILTTDAKVSINSSSTVYSLEVDDTEGDEGVNVRGELHVGSPERPAESVFGEGDSYTRGMLVYTYNNTGSVYTDVSANAASASLSTFTFTGTNSDDAIYVASDRSNLDYFEHYGIKDSVVTAANVTGGEIVTEYWDGAAWTEVTIMETESGGNYLPHANAIFEHVGSHQIRYDANLAADSWTANDPISPATGTNRYWARYRINAVSNITTAPVFEQFKLHSNRSEINGDGFQEFFGTARPSGRLPWDAGLLQPALSSPIDEDVYLSDKLDVGRIENEFANGDTDRIGFLGPLPLDADTSTPIKLNFSFIGLDSSPAGDATFNVYWGYSSPDGTVYSATDGGQPGTGTNEQTVAVTYVGVGYRAERWLTASLDISSMVSKRDGGFGDTLWVTIERVGPSDSYTGNVALIAISAEYTKWCLGGHV